HHESAFYNFFQIEHLEELNVEEAAELMGKIATWRPDPELATFLRTPLAHARLRAISALAGGHPRIWILFAGFLTRDSLHALVPVFLKMLDELTPYYQSLLNQLSGQQAQIVEYLCEKRGAVPVKEIATDNFLQENATAAQLGELAKMGYVQPERSGRESYYE